MKMKKTVIALGAALMLSLTGCGEQPQVNVEQASMLTTAAISSDKFAGMVVSENVIEIDRDSDKQIDELYVSVGDQVRVNEKLFSYDSDTLSLTIDKQKLEMDKLDQQIKDLKTQVTNLEKQIKNEKDKNTKATLELSLRTVKADLTQATYDKSSLQAEITYNETMFKNADVRSPIKGTVRSINENGSPYITIQQAGAYQVKGILNELSVNAGIMEGVVVNILSRTDPNASWIGVVSMVDYNNATSGEYDDMNGSGGDSMSTSTSYPFYITLNKTDGLLLGQHVYIQVAAAAVTDDQLRLPEGYIMDITLDESSYLNNGTVWAVDMDSMKLTKVPVTLGEYDPTYGTYVILAGITGESFLADPAAPGVKEGASVTLRSEQEYLGQTEPQETLTPAASDEFVPPEGAESGDPIEDPVSGLGDVAGDPVEDPVSNGSGEPSDPA